MLCIRIICFLYYLSHIINTSTDTLHTWFDTKGCKYNLEMPPSCALQTVMSYTVFFVVSIHYIHIAQTLVYSCLCDLSANRCSETGVWECGGIRCRLRQKMLRKTTYNGTGLIVAPSPATLHMNTENILYITKRGESSRTHRQFRMIIACWCEML